MRRLCPPAVGSRCLAARPGARRLFLAGHGRHAVANAIACVLHAWWCAHLGRPMRAPL
ncbi:hypothetical protein [Deinococcus arcticus]|uniref:hypothetical protein n=1 Tax=Deinococcus arcticus TaxID=2136176 RepID=UPI001304A831|nr:hypothetical protein [Deinococcus arcticus]